MKKIFTLIVALCFASMLIAQNPEGLSCQVVLRNEFGAVKVLNCSLLKIPILKGSISGDEVYSEKQRVTTNRLGLMSIIIGKGTPVSGCFSKIEWNTSCYYVKITTNNMEAIVNQINNTGNAICSCKSNLISQEQH